MRRPIVLAVLVVALCALALPASAAGTTKITAPLSARQGVLLTDVCPFPVQLDERGGLVVTTTLDASRTPIRYDITGRQTTVLTNLSNGLTLSFETIGRTTIEPNSDGTFTMTQVGSGLAIDPGAADGEPRLAWFTGTVVSTGTLDEASLVMQVETQTRGGVVSDVCEMLVSGLKTRH